MAERQWFTCTKANPWSKDKGTPVTHPDAKCVYDGGWEQEYERDECPHCGERVRVEIPQ